MSVKILVVVRVGDGCEALQKVLQDCVTVVDFIEENLLRSKGYTW